MVLVEWIDSFQLEAGWHLVDEATERSALVCRSVGFLIGETADVLCLAETIGANQVSGVVHIPVRAVMRRAELTFSSAFQGDA
ncbi:MAG: hypothetical protein F4206_15015 [Gammaproteobacteria bacterium]|nr:hypothetical protein [Gammaproteobacteria bacterium]